MVQQWNAVRRCGFGGLKAGIILCLAVLGEAFVVSRTSSAQTVDECVVLGTQVHGGYGAFIPLGVKIGLDARERLKADPRELDVTYYDSAAAPCACFADGVAIATRASVGQRSLRIATEPAPPGTAALIMIRPRKGGAGWRYTIPMAALPRLGAITRDNDPAGRHAAVMAADGLFEVQPVE